MKADALDYIILTFLVIAAAANLIGIWDTCQKIWGG